MIRLIATDLDGTLLDGDRQLPEGFIPFVKGLKEKGIRFCVASGRQYWSLLEEFEQVKDDVIFIAENGALVVDKGQVLSMEPLPNEKMGELIDLVNTLDGVHITICCPDAAYFQAGKLHDERGMTSAYPQLHGEKNLRDQAFREDILKISVNDENGAEKNACRILTKAFPQWQTVLSGPYYCDVMKKDVTKGSAIEKIQQIYAVSKEESMAFGDYLNDIPMMERCHYSYAMANAHPELKAVCNFETLSHTENGVMHALKSNGLI